VEGGGAFLQKPASFKFITPRFNVADQEQIALVNQLLCRNWPVFMNKRLITHLVKLGKQAFSKSWDN
jgi:hypothetical protein